MAVTTIAGKEVHVDDEGFMTEYDEWGEDLAPTLAANIGIGELTEDHWRVIKFLRSDYQVQGETATLRRVATTLALIHILRCRPSERRRTCGAACA